MNNKKENHHMKIKPQNIPKINFKNASEEKSKPGKQKSKTDKGKEQPHLFNGVILIIIKDKCI